MKVNLEPLIFLVDDEISYLRLLENYLKGYGFNSVYTFVSGEECSRYLNLNPTILVLDYNLGNNGNKNGLHILKKVRKISPCTHIIMLSGEMHHDPGLLNFIKFTKEPFKYIIKEGNDHKKLLGAILEIT